MSDVSYSDECRTKKSFSVCQEMLPLSRAVLKFCSTNRLFMNNCHVMWIRIKLTYAASNQNSRNLWWLPLTWCLLPLVPVTQKGGQLGPSYAMEYIGNDRPQNLDVRKTVNYLNPLIISTCLYIDIVSLRRM